MWNLFAIPDYLLLFTFTLATIFVHLLNILCSLYLCCNIGGTVLIFVLISMHLLLFDIGSFLLSFSKTLYISSTVLIEWEMLTSKFENGLFWHWERYDYSCQESKIYCFRVKWSTLHYIHWSFIIIRFSLQKITFWKHSYAVWLKSPPSSLHSSKYKRQSKLLRKATVQKKG